MNISINSYKIHEEGYYFIMIFFLLTLIMFFYESRASIITSVALLFCIFFFRDPKQNQTSNPNKIVSPADGIVQKIDKINISGVIGVDIIKISIFLNVFNVHINRSPVRAKVLKLHYIRGSFLNVTFDKSSYLNERQLILLETNKRYKLYIIQIAGLIARRIICNLLINRKIKNGNEIGIIKFGSRIDMYLYKGVHMNVIKGEKVTGGITVIGTGESRI